MRVENVGYHFRALEREGYIRVSRTERARGVSRNYYVATRRAELSDEEFGRMSVTVRKSWSETTLSCFLRRFRRALGAGTTDIRSNTHVSWIALLLDDQGCRELAQALAEQLKFQQEVQKRSLARMRQNAEKPVSATAAIMGFESPVEDAPRRDSVRTLVTDEDSARMNPADRRICVVTTMMELLRRCRNALAAGTFDARDDSHLSWIALLLDETGFGEIAGSMMLALAFVQALQVKSYARLLRSGERPIPMTVGLIAFQSPASDAPVGVGMRFPDD